MPTISKTIVFRIESFRAAWRELAPEAIFAGMSLAQFEEAVAPPLELRRNILALDKQLNGLRTEKSKVDETANELLELVVNSVRGTPGFGALLGICFFT